MVLVGLLVSVPVVDAVASACTLRASVRLILNGSLKPVVVYWCGGFCLPLIS